MQKGTHCGFPYDDQEKIIPLPVGDFFSPT